MPNDKEQLEPGNAAAAIIAEATKQGKLQLRERDVQDAVNETGFGRFNLRIMAVSSLTFLNVAISISSIGLILPAAACDYRMTTIDKGRLSATPMLGMLIASYFWGCLADIKGRKFSLSLALVIHATAEFLSSLIPFYWGFLAFKFFSGMAMNGEMTLVFTYLGEFQPNKYRDRLLSWMEIGWATGLILLPLIGWVIIPLDIEYRTSGFSFRSWNLFVMICSLPTMLIAIWFSRFPETPKYLAETNKNVQLYEVLSRMYAENRRKPPEEYATKLIASGKAVLYELALRVDETKRGKVETLKDEKRSYWTKCRGIFVQTLTIVKQPYLKRTIAMCFIAYAVTSSYYALSLWLPELFQRFAVHQERFPDKLASVCTVSQVPLNHSHVILDPFGCETPIQQSVYLYTVFLGVACIPTGIILPVFVDRLGYKFFLVSTALVSSAITVGLFAVTTSVQNLILSCIFESLTSICISVMMCLLVELYPTNLRAMAAGFAALFSRVGAIVGNSMFGYLIDNYCVPLIIIVAVQLFLSGVLGIFIPSKKKLEKMEKAKFVEEMQELKNNAR
ncbi:synaptic vesicle glycoprotein 2C-like [Prorops nasuta]|uniref:synaptic vesicle glycoprotein 2C-like n=1 Tax=Prorops nasuta TaxID=863751 RepID=UPI0034CDF3DA